MSLDYSVPFVGKTAYDEIARTYIPFSTQSDAMLASLLLCHKVPYDLMDVLLEVIMHPDFDSKTVSFASSFDILQTTEKARLDERLAIVQRRSFIDGRQMSRTDFPEFILHEVLSILEQERQRAVDDQRGYGEGEIKRTLLNASLVHRTWTHLAQMSLGRVVCLSQNQYYGNPCPTIFGPWTTSMTILDRHFLEPGHRRIEVRKNFFLRFSKNLKRLCIKSESRLSTGLANFLLGEIMNHVTTLETIIIRSEQNDRNEKFIEINCLIDNSNVTKRLKSLDIMGCVYRGEEIRADFSSLRDITFHCSEIAFHNSSDDVMQTFISILTCISSQPDSAFDSLTISDINHNYMVAMERKGLFTKCASLWPRLRRLRFDASDYRYSEAETQAVALFQWLVVHCTSLQEFAFSTYIHTSTLSLRDLPPTIRVLDIKFTSRPDELWAGPSWAPKFLTDIVGFIRLPALQSINIEFPTWGGGEVYEVIDEFAKKFGAECHRNGIILSCSYSVYLWRYDLRENLLRAVHAWGNIEAFEH